MRVKAVYVFAIVCLSVLAVWCYVGSLFGLTKKVHRYRFLRLIVSIRLYNEFEKQAAFVNETLEANMPMSVTIFEFKKLVKMSR